MNLEKVPCLRIWVTDYCSGNIPNRKRFVSSCNRHTRALFQVCVQRKRRFKPEKRGDQESYAVACVFKNFKVSMPPITPIRDQWESPGCTDETNCRWKYFGLQTDFDPQWSCAQFNQFPRPDSLLSAVLHPFFQLTWDDWLFKNPKKISKTLLQNFGWFIELKRRPLVTSTKQI